MNKDISFEDVRKKLDAAPEGYVPKECYEAALERATRLVDICGRLREENKYLRSMMITAIDLIYGASKKGLVNDDKD